MVPSPRLIICGVRLRSETVGRSWSRRAASYANPGPATPMRNPAVGQFGPLSGPHAPREVPIERIVEVGRAHHAERDGYDEIDPLPEIPILAPRPSLCGNDAPLTHRPVMCTIVIMLNLAPVVRADAVRIANSMHTSQSASRASQFPFGEALSFCAQLIPC